MDNSAISIVEAEVEDEFEDDDDHGAMDSDPGDTCDDNIVSLFSNASGPSASVPEEKSGATTPRSVRSITENTTSHALDLSFPEILDQLEQAVDEADRHRGNNSVDRSQNKVDLADLISMMEKEPTAPLEVLDLMEAYEKDISAQKSQITKLQCEKSKLSIQLEESRVREKRVKAKHLKEEKSLQDRISSLESNLKAFEHERNELKSREAEYLQQLRKVQEQLVVSQRNSQVRNRPPVQPKATNTETLKDKLIEEEKKRQEHLESRIAELGNRVMEYEAKEKLILSQKLERDSQSAYLKEQLNSHTVLIDSLKEELALAKIKETEFAKEKGLAEFRIRELQQELMLSRPAKPESGRGKGNPKTLDELSTLKNQVNTLKMNLKNAESSRNGLQQKNTENQKNLRKLQNQVRTLQRILYHKDPASLPPVMNVLDSAKGNKDASDKSKSDRENFLELRIAELENQLQHRYAHAQESLEQPFKLDRGAGDNEQMAMNQDKLIAELRGRLVSQMQLVNFLKENLIVAKGREAEWGKEKELFEFRIRELKEELTLAKTLGKPENQVLADLTETIQSLNSRYVYREKELDNLIRRLSLKTLTSACPPSNLPFLPTAGIPTDLYTNRQLPLGYLLGSDTTNALGGPSHNDFGILSPNTTVQLVRGSLDEFLLLNN